MLLVLSAIAALGASPQTTPPSADAASRGLYVALRVCSACHKVAFPGVGPDSAAPSFAAIHARHDAGSSQPPGRDIERRSPGDAADPDVACGNRGRGRLHRDGPAG